MLRISGWGAGAALLALAGCGSGETLESAAHINSTPKFTSKTYGVAASPRVTTAKVVRKGGGRHHVGKPYKIKGKWYKPREEPGYDRKGLASWYGPNFHGRLTANGEVYDQFALSGAHPTFPLPSYARVTNQKNGHSVIVRINDRGPFHSGRIVDVSGKAAGLLDFKRDGTAPVRVEYLGQAPLHGQDAQYLEASYRPAGGGAPPSTMVAFDGEDIQPLPTTVKPVSRRRRLDTLVTGSISKQSDETDDPFLTDLQKIRGGGITQTTLSRRMREFEEPLGR